MSATDEITISALPVDCVVGVYPHERNRPQPLEVTLNMSLDTRRAGEHERLAYTIDYAMIANEIAFLLRTCRFHMLETAAGALARWLLAAPPPGSERPRVERVELRLTKPFALAGHGIPSLNIVRTAAEVTMEREEKTWGSVDIVDETRHAGIYRLNIEPGRGIPQHVHLKMREAELILDEGILCQHEPVPAGSVMRWPLGAVHRYDNPTDRWVSILCVDSPPFMVEDEVEVDTPLADVRPEPPFIARPSVAGHNAR